MMTLPRMTLMLLGLSLAACSSSSERPAKAPTARGELIGMKVSTKVEAVDVAGRRITLKGPSGNPETFVVGEEVKRLAEIKAGDSISFEYKVAAIAELREPSADEKKAPLVVTEGADRAPSDKPPGAALARVIRVVAQIEMIDSATQSFSVRGPMGGLVRIPVADPAVLSSLKVWQGVVVTFIESALLNVEPASK